MIKKEINHQNAPKPHEVDVVYIWCDSSNPEYIKNRNFFSQKYKLNKFWSATRDHEEINHSIKSVRKNMSWVNNIFVCAPKGDRIKDLEAKKYNVIYVTNEEILWTENCPNFNSHSLELYSHKINGLSDYFILFCDDYFISSQVDLEDFFNFKNNKIKYYYENMLLLGKGMSSQTRKHVHEIVDEKYYFWSTHSPRMFYKKDVKDIVELYKDTSEDTKIAKFRTSTDIQLVYFYGYYLISKNKGDFIFLKNISSGSNFLYSLKILMWKLLSENIMSILSQIYIQTIYKKMLYKNKVFSDKEKYSLISMGDDSSRNKQKIDEALEKKVKFICLNDSYSKEKQDDIQQDYEYFYKKLLK